MRVVSGKFGGRPLNGPKHDGVRPTADRVKEALFNVWCDRVESETMLDLFGGTGGVGIEALSRGAAKVVFSDNNPQSVKLIQRNLQLLDIGKEQARILSMPAQKTIEVLAREGEKFGLIFLDPPFQAGLLEETITQLEQASLLLPDGCLVAEHPSKMVLFEECGSLHKFKIRTYGDIALSFFEY